MKANEAPEKIWVHELSAKELNIPLKEYHIEYVRTDAFIEKAEKFLEDKLTEKDCKFSWNEWTKVKSGDTPIASFMKEFRNYMKGEDKV